MKLPIAGLLILAAFGIARCLAAEAEASGSCNGPPPAAEPAQNYSVPDYAVEADGDATPDPQVEAAMRAWKEYQASIVDALNASSSPRDRALAALTGVLAFTVENSTTESPMRNAALLQASQAAPDDALVQWIALVRSNRREGPAPDPGPAENLQRLEPLNAAVWLMAMSGGVRDKNPAVVDAALQRMATSKSFNTHFSDLLLALSEAYARIPVPDAYLQALPERERQTTGKVIPQTTAFAVSSAVAFPAFQELFNACRVNPATGENAQRAADCAATGRLMSAHGDTLVASRIGAALLRVSRTFTDEDLHLARSQDWIYKQYTSVVSNAIDLQPQNYLSQLLADWSETGREIEVMRRALVRAGIAATPPDDWVDAVSAFSTEKQKADETYLAEHTGRH